MEIRALLFDMDGLMFDTETISYLGWKQAARQLQIVVPDAVIDSLRGTSVDRCRRIFNAALPGEYYDRARALRLQFAADYIHTHGIPVKPGLYELLEYLRRNRIPAALATSTERRRAMEYLEMAQVTSYFSATVFGTEVKHPKPEPDVFLAGAEALGVAPEFCLVLEDSPNGLLAAKRAGMRAVFVPDLCPDPGPAAYSWKRDTLHGVISILESENA